MTEPDVGVSDWSFELRARIERLINGYRTALHDCMVGLTEQEARLRLVESRTTLLGLLKHVTDVEGVWFDQAITGRSYREMGIASSPDRSFTSFPDSGFGPSRTCRPHTTPPAARGTPSTARSTSRVLSPPDSPAPRASSRRPSSATGSPARPGSLRPCGSSTG